MKHSLSAGWGLVSLGVYHLLVTLEWCHFSSFSSHGERTRRHGLQPLPPAQTTQTWLSPLCALTPSCRLTAITLLQSQAALHPSVYWGWLLEALLLVNLILGAVKMYLKNYSNHIFWTPCLLNRYIDIFCLLNKIHYVDVKLFSKITEYL